MFQIGNNIHSASDQLAKCDLNQIAARIKNPSPEFVNMITRLRAIQSIDYNQYRKLKTELPYFTCGIFSPPFRKTQNFASISYFIIDLDHLHDKEMNAETLKEKLKHDSQICLMFVSPGCDGLKIMFRLSDKCYDHYMYSNFYKLFARSFAIRYGIDQVIDNSNCDVTRACFFSFDPQVYFNSNCEAVEMSVTIKFDDSPEFYEKIKEAGTIVVKAESEPVSKLNEDLLLSIKQKLNPNFKPKPDKQLIVPEILNEIEPNIIERFKEMGIVVSSIENINYGKKIKVALSNRTAEVNLFYGKRGFSLVKTPKTGTNPELADITYQILYELLIQ